ncbi:MAG: WD40 repeat domain-containing protein [Moorea sp. SIO3C2]|nr:WD40 repeat domain-containing protein [Moorena sp. SIO3C2]
MAAAFDPSSNDIVLTNSDGSISIKKLNGEDINVLYGHGGEVWQAEFGPDGKRIASTAQDGIFRIWNRDGDLLQSFEHPAKVDGRIRFSPDGQYIAVSAWGRNDILLLNRDGDWVTTIQSPNVVDIAFSPDGKNLPAPPLSAL